MNKSILRYRDFDSILQEIPRVPEKDDNIIDQKSWTDTLDRESFYIERQNVVLNSLMHKDDSYEIYDNQESSMQFARRYEYPIDINYFNKAQINNLLIEWLLSIKDDHGIYKNCINENGTLNIEKFINSVQKSYEQNQLNIKIDDVPQIKEKSPADILEEE